jgi:hypothetical protein
VISYSWRANTWFFVAKETPRIKSSASAQAFRLKPCARAGILPERDATPKLMVTIQCDIRPCPRP